MPYRNPKDPRKTLKAAQKRKWKRHGDGLFHCNHPGCKYTHQRAASIGRHTAIHSGKPYARNTKKDTTPAKQRHRDYAKEYYQRQKAARTASERSMQSNGNLEQGEAVAFWIARTVAKIEQLCAINAGRVDLTAEEFGARCLAVLQGSSKALRKLYRLSDHV